jgi:hypothetical protein
MDYTIIRRIVAYIHIYKVGRVESYIGIDYAISRGTIGSIYI